MKKVDSRLKADRRGRREGELSLTNTGWNAKTKKHKTLADYSRKGKNAFKANKFYGNDN